MTTFCMLRLVYKIGVKTLFTKTIYGIGQFFLFQQVILEFVCVLLWENLLCTTKYLVTFTSMYGINQKVYRRIVTGFKWSLHLHNQDISISIQLVNNMILLSRDY